MATWDYQEWPFSSLEHLSLAQIEAWWKQCYLETASFRTFANASGSVVLFGPAGSGKTIAVKALAREQADQALIIQYDPRYWPSGEHSNIKNGDHLNQIMALAAIAVHDRLQQHPTSFWHIDDLDKVFLFWLIEKFLGRRFLHKIIRQVSESTGRSLDMPKPSSDLYPLKNPLPRHVRGQIDDLVTVATSLGFKRVLVLVDFDLFVLENLKKDLATLLSWLDMMEHSSFQIKATLPDNGDIRAQVSLWSSGRLRLLRLNIKEDELYNILERHLAAATGEKVRNIAELVEPSAVDMMKEEIIKVFGYEAPAGWLNWLQRLFNHYVYSGQKLGMDDLLSLLYKHDKMRLRLATHQPGVWRGPQFLPLDGQPFELFKKLYFLKGSSDYEALLNVADGSPQNLNTLVSRVRKVIEPVSHRHLYLQSRHKAYWLENTV